MIGLLAPWALVVAGAGALATIALHLVARQRPAAYVLPTARFIPDRRTLVSRMASRPRDLVLLALRLLLLLSAGAAFARPVLAPSTVPLRRLVLADRSGAVADAAELRERLAALPRDGVPTTLIWFDSAASMPLALEDALRQPAGPSEAAAAGSISAALAAARRAAPALGRGADSVALVLFSPVTRDEVDDATPSLRAMWPGGIRVERLRARQIEPSSLVLARAIEPSDPLYPALGSAAVADAPRATRIVRGAPGARDSAFARAGGTVVAWDSVRAAPAAVGLAVGGEVVVASMARGALPEGGRVVARWSDGAPAASEQTVGSGCIRRVGVGIPAQGDLPLRATFQRMVRDLSSACGARGGEPANDSTLRRMEGPRALASGAGLAASVAPPSRLASWLLGIALACALAELLVRRGRGVEDA